MHARSPAVLIPFLVLVSALPAQRRGDDKPDKAEEPPEVDRKVAKQALRDFDDAVGEADSEAAARRTAVEQLAALRHRSFVKPLAEVVLRDADVGVRVAAAGGLAKQPVKQAAPAVVKLLRSDPVLDAPKVTAALLEALSANGYDAKAWRFVSPLFGREFSERWVPVQLAVLRLVIEHREKQSWRLLLAHHDQPTVEGDVDHPDNPPAEYWEMRWRLWTRYRALVREALYAITGKRFENSEQAAAWIAAEGREHGLR